MTDAGEFAQGGASDNRPVVSRRTVVKAAAWSVPVLAIGSSAPAHAAQSPIVVFDGRACKLPGNSNPVYKGYTAGLAVNNPFQFQIDIKVTAFRVIGATSTLQFRGVQGPNCTFYAAGVEPRPCWPQGTTEIAAFVSDNGNSFNATVELDYEVYECGTATPILATGTVVVPLSGDTWNGGCRPHPDWPCDVPGSVEPTVQSIAPTSGVIGSSISITGLDFKDFTGSQWDVANIAFGAVAATSFGPVVDNGDGTQTIQNVVVPTGTGTVDVTVLLTTGGFDTLTSAFTYTT